MVKIIFTFIIAILMFTTCSENNPVNSSSNLPGEWIEKAEMPIGAQEILPAELDEKIYVVGGLTSSTSVSRKVYVYEPDIDSWSTAAEYPRYLHHVATASYNGKLYGFGGFQGIGIETITKDEVYEYDPISDTWTQKSPMPTARGAHGAVTFNGKIYVIGGRRFYPNITFDVVEVYDPETDTWETVSPLPTPCFHSGYVLLGDLIYVIAGRQLDYLERERINIFYVQVYSPENDQWHFSTEFPHTNSGLAAAVLNGKIYAMGGEVPFGNGSTIYWENYEFDPANESWREVAKLPVPRHGTGALTIGNFIYIVGGARNPAFGTTPLNHAFTID